MTIFIYIDKGNARSVVFPESVKMETVKKRSRKGNFSQPEVLFLVDLVDARKHIVENKRTDSVTNNEKLKAWTEICNVFNAYSPNCYRDVKSLRSKYDQLKMEAKKKMAQLKYMAHTGQNCGIELTPQEDKIISILTSIIEAEPMLDDSSYMEPLTEVKALEDIKPIVTINSSPTSLNDGIPNYLGQLDEEDEDMKEPSTSKRIKESISFICLQKEQAIKEHELRMKELQLRIMVQEKELERLDMILRKEKLEVELLENRKKLENNVELEHKKTIEEQ